MKVKQYKCEFCGKEFRTKGCIKSHIKYHIGESGFQACCIMAVQSDSTGYPLQTDMGAHIHVMFGWDLRVHLHILYTKLLHVYLNSVLEAPYNIPWAKATFI